MVDEASRLTLQKADKGFELRGIESEGEWSAHALSEDHVLLHKSQPGSENLNSFSTTSVDVFAATLIALCNRRFSGNFLIYQAGFQRRLHFRDGKLVFARSNLMDDRLGEVMYRAGLLTLDQMMEAAVQVTRSNRFGKVLIDSGNFDSPGLWEALKLQIRTIFNSLFLHEKITYQLLDDAELSRSSVSFEYEMQPFIEEALSHGFVLRTFMKRLTHESEVNLDSSVHKQVLFWGHG